MALKSHTEASLYLTLPSTDPIASAKDHTEIATAHAAAMTSYICPFEPEHPDEKKWLSRFASIIYNIPKPAFVHPIVKQ